MYEIAIFFIQVKHLSLITVSNSHQLCIFVLQINAERDEDHEFFLCYLV